MLCRHRWRFILGVAACILGGLVWAIHLQTRQSRLDEALYQAVANGEADAAERWLRRGANANAKPSDFSVMLHSAPRPLLIDPRYWPLLTRAARRGIYAGVPVTFFVKDAATARGLLEHGADPNAERRGQTWLMMAAGHGDLPVVRELLAHGADVNWRAPSGFTALHHAVLQWQEVSRGAPHQYPKVVRALLSAGADVNARTLQGLTAVTIAKRFGRADIIHLLRQAGAKG